MYAYNYYMPILCALYICTYNRITACIHMHIYSAHTHYSSLYNFYTVYPHTHTHSLYAQSTHFSRLLRLISNKLALKARDIVGVDPLETPIQSCVCIRQALRVCSAFRGYYLDRRDVAEKVMAQNRERLIQLQQESIHGSQSKERWDNFN